MRDVKQNPQAGDVVQVYPGLIGNTMPPPLTITSVDSQFVHWKRGDTTRKTPLTHWQAERLMSGYTPKMELVEADA